MTLPRTYRGVVFDMDGTLVDSTESIQRSWRQWAEEFELTEGQFQGNWHGRPATDLVSHLLPASRVHEGVERIKALEVADAHTVVTLPGAEDALHVLRANGIPIAIATSCTRDLAEARIIGAGIFRPEVVVTADDVTRGKPDPEPFRLAAEQLGLEPSEVLVVEDAVAGVTAAHAVPTECLAVLTTTPREELAAELVVEDLSRVNWVITDGGVRVEPNS
ncbi:HAD-IA family hydrolase [Enemella sp. A6]|uniref:HAD-IA family hydrolase n=1 Tax=Enemella sp. A6 TaxID=3440152 RepID=UPI003EBC4267